MGGDREVTLPLDISADVVVGVVVGLAGQLLVVDDVTSHLNFVPAPQNRSITRLLLEVKQRAHFKKKTLVVRSKAIGVYMISQHIYVANFFPFRTKFLSFTSIFFFYLGVILN